MTRNRPAFIATVIVAFLAVALAVFAVWQMTLNNNESGSNDTFVPSNALNDEMHSAVQELLKDNYEIVKLYYIQGLPAKDEPYGNIPQDGILTVDSDEFKTLADIEAYVDSVFVSAQAEKIKDNPNGNGPVYFDRGGVLGISYNFKPVSDYPYSWEKTSYILDPESDAECAVMVTVANNGGGDTDFETSMVKENGKWRLTTIIYQ